MDQSSPASQNPYASPAVPPNTESSSSSPNKPNEPLVQPIHILGELSFEDFIFSTKYIRRFGPAKYIFVFSWIISAFMCLILCPALYQASKNLQFGFRVAIFVVPVIMLIIYIGLKIFLSNFAYKKAWEYSKSAFSNINELIFEEYFESMSEKENTRIKWSAFGTYHVRDRLAIILFQEQKYRYHIFPRNCFQSQHDWECFLGLLDRKMRRC